LQKNEVTLQAQGKQGALSEIKSSTNRLVLLVAIPWVHI